MHANTQVPAHRRDQLERLIRYTARGAVSLERLAQDANGDLVYPCTHRWSDGTIGIRLSPLELLEKLAALVPLPRVHWSGGRRRGASEGALPRCRAEMPFEIPIRIRPPYDVLSQLTSRKSY